MMGPFCGRRARSTRKSSRKRTLSKNQFKKSKDQESPILPIDSPVKPPIDCSSDLEDAEMLTSSACSTPKAERFRIPEIKTCPPAPKKRRMMASCSLRRTSIAFFAPPDIELFFNLALCGGIPV